MEKKQKNTFGSGPWIMKKVAMEHFIAVTEGNRKQARVAGRIFYVIEKSGHQFVFCGTFSIDPPFTQGWWHVPFKPWMKGFPGHFRVYMNSNVDYNTWVAENKYMLDKFITEKKLYINTRDPILTFKQEQK